MLTEACCTSSQPRSHVQVNIYGTTVDALRRRGVDLERLISSLGCHCVVMDVPEITSEVQDLVSVTSLQGSCSANEDCMSIDTSNRSGGTSTANEVSVQLPKKPPLEIEHHESEARSSTTPISELSPDSFVDLNIFPSLHGNSGAASLGSCAGPSTATDGDKADRSYDEGFSVKVEPCEVETSEVITGRVSRKRTPRLSFTPRESPELLRKKKMKLLAGFRATSNTEFQCRIPGCGKILHFKQSCRRQGLDHVRSHFSRKTRRCKLCDYSGNTNASVYTHHSSRHANEPYPGPLAAETKEDITELQRLFKQAFPEIPGIESYIM